MATSETFVYERLSLEKDCIRVLKVSPRRSRSNIECQLQQVHIKDAEYACLSYMWGDDNDCDFVIVNGKKLLVRRNLSNFLHLAQKLKIKDRLWIDAICINQEDVNERNHQVQLMAQIYRTAKYVFVHPGLVPWRLVQELKRSEGGKKSMFNSQLKSRRNSELSHNLERSLAEVADLPYWNRTWIVQEILLARYCFVVTERELVSWRRFRMLYLEEGFGNTSRPVTRLCETRKDGVVSIRPNLRGPPRLVHYLETYRETQGHDVRDRVYSLLGMVQDADGFAVDYRKTPAVLLLDSLEHFSDKYDGNTGLGDLVLTLSENLKVSVGAVCFNCSARSIKLHLRGNERPDWNMFILITNPSTGSFERDADFECCYCNATNPWPFRNAHPDMDYLVSMTRLSEDKLLCEFNSNGSEESRLIGRHVMPNKKRIRRVRSKYWSSRSAETNNAESGIECR